MAPVLPRSPRTPFAPPGYFSASATLPNSAPVSSGPSSATMANCSLLRRALTKSGPARVGAGGDQLARPDPVQRASISFLPKRDIPAGPVLASGGFLGGGTTTRLGTVRQQPVNNAPVRDAPVMNTLARCDLAMTEPRRNEPMKPASTSFAPAKLIPAVSDLAKLFPAEHGLVPGNSERSALATPKPRVVVAVPDPRLLFPASYGLETGALKARAPPDSVRAEMILTVSASTKLNRERDDQTSAALTVTGWQQRVSTWVDEQAQI
jgi:hypothetical protein